MIFKIIRILIKQIPKLKTVINLFSIYNNKVLILIKNKIF